MSHHANSEERRRLIVGLRDLAEFLDQHPQVPAPVRAYVMVFPPDRSDAEMFAEIDAIAGQVGATASDAGSPRGHYTAVRSFGPVEYRAVAIPLSDRDESGRDE